MTCPITLRTYQEKGATDIREAFTQRIARVLYQLPTGGGKTILFCYIALMAMQRGNIVWIVVHRRELVKQTVAKLKAFGVPCGVMAAGWTPNPSMPVQVCLIDSMPSRMANYPQPNLLIEDEAHHVVSPKWLKILTAFPSARHLGVTATPIRLDGKGLGDFYQHIITGPPVRELMDQGALCGAEIWYFDSVDLSKVHTVAGDFNKKEIGQVMDNSVILSAAVERYRQYADNTPAIAFCVNLDHAEHVAQQFRDAGYNALRVDGGMAQDDRDAAINGLADGSVKVLTSCDLISEGVDVPVVATAILLRTTKSLSLYLQQVGRVLRPAEGKPHANILDHAGNVIRHGTPWRDRQWTLDGVDKKPKTSAPAPVTQCSHCYRVYEGRGECPYCGFVPVAQGRSIREVEGQLVKLTKEREAKLEADRKKREVWGATSRADLERIAEERNYSPGWVRLQLQLRKRYGRPLADDNEKEAAVA